MNDYITTDQYINLVAAIANGISQNPAILQYTDPYQISTMVSQVMQGVEQALNQSNLQIIHEEQK